MPKPDNQLSFDDVVDWANITRAYAQTQKGYRKFKAESIRFHQYDTLNLVRIWRALRSGRYRPGEYIRFRVYEPKPRLVSAPRLPDKIVQFATHTVLQEIYRPVFIADSCSCLDGRGPQRAAFRLQHYMRKCKWLHGDGWVIKLDVEKFFYRIDRDILKRIIRKKVTDGRLLRLLDTIIDSSPEGKVGLPLGNVTSQDFANIYLNELDQYVKRYLGIRWYVRYGDDVTAVVATREEARAVLAKMQRFLRERLRLNTNEKTKIFPLRQGVNAYGYKIWTTHMLVRDDSKRRMKRRIKAMDRKLKTGEIGLKEVKQAVNAWLGHARHSNSYNLAKRIFKNYPYIKVEGEKKFGELLRGRRARDAAKGRRGAAKANKAVAD